MALMVSFLPSGLAAPLSSCAVTLTSLFYWTEESRLARSGLILKLAAALLDYFDAPVGLLEVLVFLPPGGFVAPFEALPAPNLVTVVDCGLFMSTMAVAPAPPPFCLPSSFLRFLFLRGGLPSERQTESSSSEISSMMSDVSAASLFAPVVAFEFCAVAPFLTALLQLLSSE